MGAQIHARGDNELVSFSNALYKLYIKHGKIINVRK